jgi:hypothetical protein
MGLFLKDACFPFCGMVSAASCLVIGLRVYSANSFSEFVGFQNFHIEIKPKGFVCNPCDSYLSFDEEALLKNR